MKKPKLMFGIAVLASLSIALAADNMAELAAKAKIEGKIVSYGIPNDWLNYEKMWSVFTKRYGVTQQDTDMSSAEEIAKFLGEKNAPVADVGDVGLAFGPIGTEAGAFLPYKVAKWNEIPDWAKDKDGHYAAAYSGVVAFIVNPKLVKNVPLSWRDLLRPEYKGKIAMSDPRRAAVAQYGVIAAAIALGGSETKIQPGIDFFAKLQKSGNLLPTAPSLAAIQKGEIAISINWDYNGLNFKRTLGAELPLEIRIPLDGTTTGPYAPVINKFTARPNVAKLFMEFLFSDEGQLLYAEGGAQPIRPNIIKKLPADVRAKLIPSYQYTKVVPIKAWKQMPDIVKGIGDKWATEVLGQ
jgi:putative spermidine/putrescine transport system substrate-binding protein